MSELKNGILNVNGFLLSKDTKPADFEALGENEVNIEVTRRGNTFVEFVRPILGSGFLGYVNVDFYVDSPYPKIAILPMVVDSIKDSENRAKIALYSSKKWLKSVMDIEPASEGDTSILYSFDWGYITARCDIDREYGLVGGHITINYEG